MDAEGIERILNLFGVDKIKHVSGNIMSSCPFAPYTHKKGTDRNPSFSMQINPAGTSAWRCFSCGEAANKSISLIYRMKDHSGRWNDLAHQVVIETEYGSITNRIRKLKKWEDYSPKASSDYKAVWKVDDYERTFDLKNYEHLLHTIPEYAIKRGITPELAKAWHIGFSRKLQRVIFVMLDENKKMFGWSGRAIHSWQEPKYLHAKMMARNKYLYGEDHLDRSKHLGFLMEGFMDVLNLSKMGLRNCLATMGVIPSSQQIEKIKKWFDTVFIFPHDDEPRAKDGVRVGLKMAEDYKSALSAAGLEVMIAPIVPQKRIFVSEDGTKEFRNPKDPGEWSRADLDWVFDKLRKQRDAIKTKKVGSEAQKSGAEKESLAPKRQPETQTDQPT